VIDAGGLRTAAREDSLRGQAMQSLISTFEKR
jgi:hypothetical protein